MKIYVLVFTERKWMGRMDDLMDMDDQVVLFSSSALRVLFSQGNKRNEEIPNSTESLVVLTSLFPQAKAGTQIYPASGTLLLNVTFEHPWFR